MIFYHRHIIDIPRIKNNGATMSLGERTVLGWELIIAVRSEQIQQFSG